MREPVPTLVRVVLEVIQLSSQRHEDSVGRQEVIHFEGAVVADSERTVLQLADQWSPCAL